jgi:hypothetical protein
MVFLFVVMLFDLLWFAIVGRSNPNISLQKWVVVNLVTALVCLVVYVPFTILSDPLVSEALLVIPVVIVSVMDIRELVGGLELFHAWHNKALAGLLTSALSYRQPPTVDLGEQIRKEQVIAQTLKDKGYRVDASEGPVKLYYGKNPVFEATMARGGINLTSLDVGLADLNLPKKFHYRVAENGQFNLGNMFLKALKTYDPLVRSDTKSESSTPLTLEPPPPEQENEKGVSK